MVSFCCPLVITQPLPQPHMMPPASRSIVSRRKSGFPEKGKGVRLPVMTSEPLPDEKNAPGPPGHSRQFQSQHYLQLGNHHRVNDVDDTITGGYVCGGDAGIPSEGAAVGDGQVRIGPDVAAVKHFYSFGVVAIEHAV